MSNNTRNPKKTIRVVWIQLHFLDIDSKKLEIWSFAAKSVMPTRTTSSRASLGLRRLFCFTNKSSLRFVSPLLLSAIQSTPLRYRGRSRVPRAYHDHACFVCSVVNALATSPLRYQSLAGKSVINTRTIKETSFVCQSKRGFFV